MGMIIALSAPSLNRVRAKARDMKCLANLRTHSAVFSTYTQDWKDLFPCYTDPAATVTIIRSEDLVEGLEYFWGYSMWNLVLAEPYYLSSWRNPVFRSSRESLAYCSYWYSQVFRAAPEYWNPTTRTGPAQWRAVAHHEVTFPSQKILLLRGDPFPGFSLGGTMLVAAVDGHARWLAMKDLHRGYPRGEGNWPGTLLHSEMPGMHTIDGVRGRDFD